MRYLGNKTRMLKNIEKFIEEHNIIGNSFCDLFSGSASVCDYFKDKYKIIGNDMLKSSYFITTAKVRNSSTPSFDNFKNIYGIDFFEYFNNKEYDFNENHFIWKNYSPAGDRQFFIEEIANKIDGIRLEIEELFNNGVITKDEYFFAIASLLENVMGVSNTTGTYEAFLKKWDSRAFKKFIYQPLEIETKKLYCENNIVYNEDSNALIKKIEGDILYLDTPYTVTEYSSAYHLLETIVLYDNPEIRGITGRRVNRPAKSDYTKKNSVKLAYEELIKNAKFKHIIISYSTQSLLPIDDLTEMLKIYAKDRQVIVQKYPFREYKNIRSSLKDDGNGLNEVLIYLEKDVDIIKSPLNYSGSKNYIVDQIIDNLPKHFNTFVDAMGGAFNVGININSQKVVYNEYNKYVFEIVKMLLHANSNELIKEIEKTIDKYQLEKGNKEKYINFRDVYNENQTPLYLFILQMYCFQNQLRFNSKHLFNTPVGNCAYNESTSERIYKFKPKAKEVELLNLDFNDIELSLFEKDTVFYFDPPYIITNATYNDGKRGFKGWDIEQEKRLLKFLEKINNNNQKFMLSNVIYHNGKTNELLLNWCKENNFRIIELIPHSGRYGSRKEVLVVNY